MIFYNKFYILLTSFILMQAGTINAFWKEGGGIGSSWPEQETSQESHIEGIGMAHPQVPKQNVPLNTITLVSAEGKEFIVPKEVALQAGVLKDMFENSVLAKNLSNRFTFRLIDSKTMEDIKNIMWAIHRSGSLKGKALIAFLNDEVNICIPLELFKAGHLLDFKILMIFAVKNLKTDLPKIREMIQKKQLSEDIIRALTYFSYLINGKDKTKELNPFFRESDYSLSEQDIKEYNPKPVAQFMHV